MKDGVAVAPGQFVARRPKIEHCGAHSFKYHIDFDALDVPDDVVDLRRFASHCAGADAARRRGDLETARHELETALAALDRVSSLLPGPVRAVLGHRGA